jgi:hypothetical protein
VPEIDHSADGGRGVECQTEKSVLFAVIGKLAGENGTESV